MKTIFLKKILPIGVGMMAVAFAFATEAQSSKKDAFVNGYIFNTLTSKCEPVDQDCNNIENIPCTYLNSSGPQIFRFNNDTFCSVPMTHRP
ncbi:MULTISPECIES: DUF6520 family protein [Empedobacter]|uniref:Uncharacterized protein n=1 Tax=Empedobacter falsenii TaxID=343874 RepID=A0A7H9DRI5_9FLAO|nr:MULTISPECIES: DUF6520 family protein [Empedobacter]MDH2208424.1 DUF6520 family protein [Empedobacter sp. GD03644]QLL57792.1 hypothetical protein FH779_06745 [Empedobacter falsenii]